MNSKPEPITPDVKIDPETGEISGEALGDDFEINAADGTQRFPKAVSLTDLIFMLEDGAFNQDAAEHLHDFAASMEEFGCNTGAKVKGTVTLKIAVERTDDGIYFFTPDLAFKLPPEKRQRTIGWVTDDNHFTPNKPNQGQLFGTVREIKQDARVIR